MESAGVQRRGMGIEGHGSLYPVLCRPIGQSIRLDRGLNGSGTY